MSTRYVWNKYLSEVSVSRGPEVERLQFPGNPGDSYYATICDNKNYLTPGDETYQGKPYAQISVVTEYWQIEQYGEEEKSISSNEYLMPDSPSCKGAIYNPQGFLANTNFIDGGGAYMVFVPAAYYALFGYEKGASAGTVSNASSSTYPLNNNCCRIAKICVILPLLFWGYRHVK